ncbi:MAG: outer membrane beta-barrel protein [Cyclobacteriaceae bacterium]|nr:outer membrane beta-barrel protein [Cyclobacteriaceae bacterium]
MSMIHCVGQHEQTHSTDSLKVLAAQEIKTEHSVTHHQNKTRKKIWPIDWNNLPYSFDDMTLLVGINTSGIYYSNNYRELSYITGYSIGVEDFIPVFERAFFHFGLKYTRRGFEHSDYHVKFKTHNIDVPLFLSYELPALRMNDLRLLIGSQLVFRTGSTTEGAYTSPGDYYRYYPTQFSNFDFGFMFGLSAEFNNFYTTVRSFSGFVKLMPDDTGMNSTFSLEVGYFIFRNLRK